MPRPCLTLNAPPPRPLFFRTRAGPMLPTSSRTTPAPLRVLPAGAPLMRSAGEPTVLTKPSETSERPKRPRSPTSRMRHYPRRTGVPPRAWQRSLSHSIVQGTRSTTANLLSPPRLGGRAMPAAAGSWTRRSAGA